MGTSREEAKDNTQADLLKKPISARQTSDSMSCSPLTEQEKTDLATILQEDEDSDFSPAELATPSFLPPDNIPPAEEFKAAIKVDLSLEDLSNPKTRKKYFLEAKQAYSFFAKKAQKEKSELIEDFSALFCFPKDKKVENNLRHYVDNLININHLSKKTILAAAIYIDRYKANPKSPLLTKDDMKFFVASAFWIAAYYHETIPKDKKQFAQSAQCSPDEIDAAEIVFLQNIRIVKRPPPEELIDGNIFIDNSTFDSYEKKVTMKKPTSAQQPPARPPIIKGNSFDRFRLTFRSSSAKATARPATAGVQTSRNHALVAARR